MLLVHEEYQSSRVGNRQFLRSMVPYHEFLIFFDLPLDSPVN